MKLLTKKFFIPAVKLKGKSKTRPSFFERARKSIIKAKKGAGRNLSASIDTIAYDI